MEVLAEACEGAKHGEEKACLDCLITKNWPEGSLERAQRIIHHVQSLHLLPVLLWDVVDKSISLGKSFLGWIFRQWAVRTGHLTLE